LLKPEINTWPIKIGLKSFNAKLNGEVMLATFVRIFAQKVTRLLSPI
jgi:hypothetical protein